MLEDLLERSYQQMLKWGAVLTRGDKSLAQEIVHDLCLYFTVAKPDLSRVANLDGYFYTSLRHIYLSSIARASRDAVQCISVADYDCLEFALHPRATERLLDRQNELRRICNYTVWRKETSKSASYFILLFFHGYTRAQIAAISCLPVAAIYNKVKDARTEVRRHLAEENSFHLVSRQAPPQMVARLSPVGSVELFDELQQMIFRSRHSECLLQNVLLNYYQAQNPNPIPCSLLAHVVSCKCCLGLLDEYFKWQVGEDHDPPTGVWDQIDRKNANTTVDGAMSFAEMMSTVRWTRDRILHHRPQALSIAVNGGIVAFHDVQGAKSSLTARVEQLATGQFVEVFSDQQIRLLMLVVDELPPGGPAELSQTVVLSDDRWLKLLLSFDGLGLHCEVTYCDPVLAEQWVEDESAKVHAALADIEVPVLARDTIYRSPQLTLIDRFKHIFEMRRQSLAWVGIIAFALVLSGTGYLLYRRNLGEGQTAEVLLQNSIQVERSLSQGQTGHQLLHLEAAGADGRMLWQGNVESWSVGSSGQSVKKLYDAQQKLVATASQGSDGHTLLTLDSAVEASAGIERVVAESGLWQQEVTARHFREMNSDRLQMHANDQGYVLEAAHVTVTAPHIVYARLVLDRRLHVLGETLRLRGDSPIAEIRFSDLRQEEVRDVAPSGIRSDSSGADTLRKSFGVPSATDEQVAHASGVTDVQLVQLHIAVLRALNKLHADTGDPISVNRTHGGKIRILGSVEAVNRKRQIESALRALPNQQRLEVQLRAQSELRGLDRNTRSAPHAPSAVYATGSASAPADGVLRRYYSLHGKSEERTNLAVTHFTNDALEKARLALQHAYALNRLGTAFTPAELQSAGLAAEQQWAQMAAGHGVLLERELYELQSMFSQIEPDAHPAARVSAAQAAIESPAQFANESSRLLRQVQTLNSNIGQALTSGPTATGIADGDALLARTLQSIPLQAATHVKDFAVRLADGSHVTDPTGKDRGRE